MYLIAAVAVVVCFGFRRAGHRSGPAVVAAIVAAVVLGYVLYTSFHPFPPSPLRVYLLIFCGIMLAAAAGYLWLRYRAPAALERIGSLAGPARDLRESGPAAGDAGA